MEDGSAKLSATGTVASREYAHRVFAHKGEDDSYNIKAQFKETEGTGTKSDGLGIVGRRLHIASAESAQQVGYQENQQYGAKPYASAPTIAPAASAIVPASGA